ncbi:twin-arginine translocase TatA/TatE family subunit [Phenylobacterium aquaticum]|jgi:sec-independent protein translocase protein TatA|uniref:twin-arginine translocase TatA/TatE family subunit n=1 Tax=Phenylobacterium aquaticum TaxID=1763816 RepID=UPI0026EE5257|nr:twin-arginine translocase TatA/TatE family subunit [Phenylobacterium aquaticum]
MGGLSWVHWVIVIGVAALLFGGGGKLSGLMGDAAKGIRAFRDGLKGEEEVADKSTAATATPLPRTEREKDEVRS